MIKKIKNKKVFNIISVVVFLLSSTLMAVDGSTSESKVTKNSIVTQNHHSMSMDQKQHHSEGVSENVSIIANPSIVVYVNGMVCSFCVQGIKKSFKSHKSIKEVTVSLKDKTVELKLKRFRTISDKKIQLIINDAGYNIKEIKR